MPISAGAGALGGSAISGVLGYLGQKSANKANAKEARLNRAFQERMSNTAHVRETKDLEKAGLNRILGVSQSGASSPSGGQAVHKNELEVASNSAAQLAMMHAQIKKLNAETTLTENKSAITSPAANVGAVVSDRLESFINSAKGVWNDPKRDLTGFAKSLVTHDKFKNRSKKKRKYLEIDIRKHSKHYAPKRSRP